MMTSERNPLSGFLVLAGMAMSVVPASIQLSVIIWNPGKGRYL